tara:strand:- start:1310 stop:1435 length:126 start_codon:yes stop_codon:yes gene_type:complete
MGAKWIYPPDLQPALPVMVHVDLFIEKLLWVPLAHLVNALA